MSCRPRLLRTHERQQVMLQMRPSRSHFSRMPLGWWRRCRWWWIDGVLQGRCQPRDATPTFAWPLFRQMLTFYPKCGEMGHIARNCPKAGGNYGGGSYGGGMGGGAGKTCYSCGGYGHMSRKLHQKKNPFPSRRCGQVLRRCLGECVNGMKCYNCGESGHYSRDCPKESSGGEKICYKCQQAGHVQSACPN